MSTYIIIAAAIVGGTGIFIGLFLGFAGKAFAIKTDPKEEAILEVLPGNNCGGCGYAGCAALAKAIAKGEAPCGQCPVGGDDVGSKVAAIMGTRATKSAKKVATVKCLGSCDHTTNSYNYEGVETCKSAAYMQNKGPKSCQFGCMGFGDCMRVCDFHAINIVNGIAVIDWMQCRGCGKCIDTCPRGIIELVTPGKPEKSKVMCNSNDTGKLVRQVCDFGCIGCGACARVCEYDAIKIENNLAHIDPEKCVGCKKCRTACPRGVIK